MIFERFLVEEDLARIRRANLPPDQLAKEEAKEEQGRKNLSSLEKNDVLAMILAVMSIILPYAAIIVGVVGLCLLAFKLLF